MESNHDLAFISGRYNHQKHTWAKRGTQSNQTSGYANRNKYMPLYTGWGGFFSLLLSHTSTALKRTLWAYILPMATPKRICLCLSSWPHSTKSIIMGSHPGNYQWVQPLSASRLSKFLHSVWMGRPLNISLVQKRKESSRKNPKLLMELQFLSHPSNTNSPHQCHKQYLPLHFYFTYKLRNISWMQGRSSKYHPK